MELVIGIEPTTYWLQISCSAYWATPAYGREVSTWTTTIWVKVRCDNLFTTSLYGASKETRTPDSCLEGSCVSTTPYLQKTAEAVILLIVLKPFYNKAY